MVGNRARIRSRLPAQTPVGPSLKMRNPVKNITARASVLHSLTGDRRPDNYCSRGILGICGTFSCVFGRTGFCRHGLNWRPRRFRFLKVRRRGPWCWSHWHYRRRWRGTRISLRSGRRARVRRYERSYSQTPVISASACHRFGIAHAGPFKRGPISSSRNRARCCTGHGIPTSAH